MELPNEEWFSFGAGTADPDTIRRVLAYLAEHPEAMEELRQPHQTKTGGLARTQADEMLESPKSPCPGAGPMKHDGQLGQIIDTRIVEWINTTVPNTVGEDEQTDKVKELWSGNESARNGHDR